MYIYFLKKVTKTRRIVQYTDLSQAQTKHVQISLNIYLKSKKKSLENLNNQRQKKMICMKKKENI